MVIIGVSSVSKCVCVSWSVEGVIRVSGEERGPEREEAWGERNEDYVGRRENMCRVRVWSVEN